LRKVEDASEKAIHNAFDLNKTSQNAAKPIDKKKTVANSKLTLLSKYTNEDPILINQKSENPDPFSGKIIIK
jgi:hypothetical protein